MNTAVLIVIAVLVVMNINSFAFMAADKKKAQKGVRRTPEKTLFLMTGLFGGLGGVLGMIIMRHKTKHWYFAVFFPVMLILQCVILYFVFRMISA